MRVTMYKLFKTENVNNFNDKEDEEEVINNAVNLGTHVNLELETEDIYYLLEQSFAGAKKIKTKT